MSSDGPPSLITQHTALVRSLALMSLPTEPAFDRITRLARRLLGVPFACITFIDHGELLVKSVDTITGEGSAALDPAAMAGLSDWVAAQGRPLALPDMDHPMPSGIGAYLGLPITRQSGEVIGTLCAATTQPRQWHADDVAALRDLALCLTSEIERRLVESYTLTLTEAYPSLFYISAGPHSPSATIIHAPTPLFGLTGSALNADPQLWFRHVHPDDRLRVEAAARLSLTQGSVLSLEYRLLTPSGQTAWVEDRAIVIPGDERHPPYLKGVVVDITARKQTESDLRQARDQLEVIVERVSEAITLWGPGNRLRYANPAAVRASGSPSLQALLTRGEMHWWDGYEAWTEDGQRLDPGRDPVQRALQGVPSPALTVRLQDPATGETRWLIARAMPVFDEGGQVQMAILINHDITEIKEHEAQLREREQIFRLLFNQNPFPMWLFDPESLGFLEVNSAAEICYGYSRAEFLTLRLGDIQPDGQRALLQRQTAVSDSQPAPSLEASHRRKDGSLLDVLITVQPFEFHGQPVMLAVVQDISSRKEAEESRTILEMAVQQLHESVVIATLAPHDHPRVVFLNEAFTTLTGYTAEEVIGKNLPFLNEPPLASVYNQGQPLAPTTASQGEALKRRKDGSSFFAEWVHAFVRNPGGEITYLVAIHRDITPRKRAEQRDTAQYAVTRILSEASSIARAIPRLLLSISKILDWELAEFWELEAGGLALRDTWHLPNLPADEFIQIGKGLQLAHGEGVPGIIWEVGQGVWYPEVAQSLAQGRVSLGAELDLQSAVGFPIPEQHKLYGVMVFFSRTSRPVDEEQLSLLSAIGSQIGQFVERTRAEEALRRSESFSRAVLNSLQWNIAVLNRQGVITAVNAAWIEFAYSNGATDLAAVGVGSNYLEVCHNASTSQEEAGRIAVGLENVLSGRSSEFSIEYPCHSPTEQRWFLMRATPLVDSPGGAVVSHINITDQKLAEQRLVQTERLAALGKMAAALAHEINNPLQAIRSYLDLVVDFPLEPEERDEYLRIVREEIESLSSGTLRVLHFARPVQASKRPLSLNALIEQTLALVRKQLQHAQLHLSVVLPPLPPVIGSAEQLTQVFLNLILNAIEATPRHGTIQVIGESENNKLSIYFINDGPPIAPEHLPRLFEPFFTTKPDGNGLGLSISARLIEEHSGTITGGNLPHRAGVIFTVTLPVTYPRMPESLESDRRK